MIPFHPTMNPNEPTQAIPSHLPSPTNVTKFLGIEAYVSCLAGASSYWQLATKSRICCRTFCKILGVLLITYFYLFLYAYFIWVSLSAGADLSNLLCNPYCAESTSLGAVAVWGCIRAEHNWERWWASCGGGGQRQKHASRMQAECKQNVSRSQASERRCWEVTKHGEGFGLPYSAVDV